MKKEEGDNMGKGRTQKALGSKAFGK